MDVKYHHHEVGGSGQLEIEVELGEMTRLADATMAAKYVIRNTAAANGMTATLMPKPIYGEAGNGMHVHMLLRKNGQPVFYDPDGYGQLSRTAMHFIGGLLTSDAEPQHEFLQAPHPRLRGPCHHRLCHGEPQRRRAHPGLC